VPGSRRSAAEVDAAVPLTEFAWRFRYPGEPAELAPREAEEALAVARRLFEAVVALLPGAMRE